MYPENNSSFLQVMNSSAMRRWLASFLLTICLAANSTAVTLSRFDAFGIPATRVTETITGQTLCEQQLSL